MEEKRDKLNPEEVVVGSKSSVLDIPIFHSAYELIKLLYQRRAVVEKAYRYTLWVECEKAALELLRLLNTTSKKKEGDRKHVLEEISCLVDHLKLLVRLASDIRAIQLKHYTEIQTILQEIGKMVGGWIKFASH